MHAVHTRPLNHTLNLQKQESWLASFTGPCISNVMSTADAVYWALAETQGDGEWEVRMKWEAEGGRVRGLAGYSRNEKNLAAAHCVLVMRSMCRWGALLLISGGSQAFHARLVRGGQRGHWYWVTAIARGWEGAFRGSAERERERFTAPFSLLVRPVPLCHDQMLL